MSLVGALLERRFESYPAESISQKPSGPLLAALGGGLTASGVPMNEKIAETIPAVYACVNFRARVVGQVPIVLYRRTESDGRERALTHPLYSVVHASPNPEMTPSVFKSTLERQKWLYGDAYAEIVRNRDGEVVALWPLCSPLVEVTRDRLNRLTYVYHLPGGEPIVWTFDRRNPPIMHLRINSLDGIHGRSPIKVLRDSLGFTKAIEQFGQTLFGNSSKPAGVIKGPAGVKIDPTVAKQMREDWERLHRGQENWHRIAVLQNGYEFQQIGLDPVDAQFVETKKLQLAEVARIFSLPPHVIGDLERSTNNNIEHQGLELVTYHLMPDFVDWEEAIGRDLISQKSFGTHYAQFNVDALLRGDAESRANALQVRRQNGVITGNEWRKLDDLNPIPAEEGGDALLVNGNMIPLTTAMKAERQPQNPNPNAE